MASVNRSARSAAKTSRGFSLNTALGALLSVSLVAGSAWGLAVTLGAMHEAARTLSDGRSSFDLALSAGPRFDPKPIAVKSSRFRKVPESDIRGYQLSAEAVLSAHRKSLAAELALADKREKADRVPVLASAMETKTAAAPLPSLTGKPAVVAALVEDVPLEEATQPFDLVLAKGEGEDEEDLALPTDVPLPEARPRIEATLPAGKPAETKPASAKGAAPKAELAYAKPGRTLFGDLFGSKSSSTGWPGSNTKVAIYDVSNATVYLPNGTKLRAHSGIGHMRDNPRYENVKMTGPTPAGIYRLSMREKRFYGVEAIRMTSIDGRDPKNRTGLLTHTNLLRGQTGSHGCVAFQNYEPFLKAFKRGEINMMVVVPELPSSRTQLAALYRKAGA